MTGPDRPRHWQVSACLALTALASLLVATVSTRQASALLGDSALAGVVTTSTFALMAALGSSRVGRFATAVGAGWAAVAAGLVAAASAWWIAQPGGAGALMGGGHHATLGLLLAVGTIAPAAFLLGATVRRLIPTVRYWCGSMACGAAAGVSLANLVLIELVGLPSTAWFAGLLLLTVGGWLLWNAAVGRTLGAAPDRVAAAPGVGAHPGYARWAALGALGALGSLMAVYWTVWRRLGTLVVGGSTTAQGVALACLFAFVAVGVVGGRWARDRSGWNPLRALGWALMCVGVSVLALVPALPSAADLVANVGALGQRPGLAAALVVGGWMAIPAVLAGACLACATGVWSSMGGPRSASCAAYAAGIGFGLPVSGLVLLPLLGLQPLLYAGASAALALGLGALLAAGMNQHRAGQLAAAAAILYALFTLSAGRWDYAALSGAWIPTDRASLGEVRFQSDGVESTVVVLEAGGRTLLIDGQVRSAVRPRGDGLGHLAMLLHPHPQSALIVGVGAGETFAAVAEYAGVNIDVAEPSRLVVHGLRAVAPENHAALSAPNVRLLLMPGTQALGASDTLYDVIVVDPVRPWSARTAAHYTGEWLRAARGRMSPDGVLALALDPCCMDDEVLTRTLRTLAAVFQDVTVWRFGASDVVVVASLAAVDPSPAGLDARLSALASSGPFPRSLGPNGLAPYRVLTGVQVRALVGEHGPQHRAGHPWLEFHAALPAHLRGPTTVLRIAP